MRVPDKVKKAYSSDSTNKYISICFPDTDQIINPEQIDFESMELTESIMRSGNVEFVGCIASMFQIKIRKLKEDIKGKKITVKIHTDGTEEITLFNGIVDSAINQSNKQIKQITAYDILYTKGEQNVGEWYKGLKVPISLKDLRDSLFKYIGIEQVETELPNDDVMISKKYSPEQLKARDVAKAICQINGACGIINRQEKFEYRMLGATYPSFYHEEPAAENDEEKNNENFSYYRDVQFEDYTVKPVDMVTIRQTEDGKGVTYGSGTNNYIIQGNMFTLGLKDNVLQEIAQKIHSCVSGVEFYPFTGINNGLPFVEVGLDTVSYNIPNFDSLDDPEADPYTERRFYVMSRHLTGIQALKDSYSAEGEEYQTEFITDLQVRIDTLKKSVKQEVEEQTFNKDEITSMIETSGWDIISLPKGSIPPDPGKPKTVYLIQGEVTIE